MWYFTTGLLIWIILGVFVLYLCRAASRKVPKPCEIEKSRTSTAEVKDRRNHLKETVISFFRKRESKHVSVEWQTSPESDL